MDNQDNDIKLSKAHTLDAPADFVKRSDSISYFKTLKHSSRSSRYSAYVRTHAEQSHAAKRYFFWEWDVTILKITKCLQIRLLKQKLGKNYNYKSG